ncbi:MAG: acyltransferase [Lachnospiraceae bacterium]|nr:acyltransferase [Lachnospiraceae bacterium]
MEKKTVSEIDFIKLIAAIFVVFGHIRFPGTFGECIFNLAQFAVPVFFMLAGYFTVLSSPFGKYVKRIKKLVVMFLIASVVYLALGLISGSGEINKILSVKGVLRFLLLNDAEFIKYHLWFLPALIYTYLFVYLLHRLLGDKIYWMILSLVIFWPVAYSIWSFFTGSTINYVLYRNFLFDGIPFFLLGNLIKKHEERIAERLRLSILLPALTAAVAVQVLLTILQVIFTEVGFGIISIIVFLICVYFKNNPSDCRIRISPDISLFVYLVHPLFITVVKRLLPTLSNWIAPIVVALVSVTCAYVYSMGKRKIKLKNRN